MFAFALPRGGSSATVERARAADALVAQGHVDEAQTAWAHLWDEQPGDAALAARLAWAAMQHDDRAVATVWWLRGDRAEARDPALASIASRVREAGGMVGAPSRALPLTSTEWACLAFVLMVCVGLLLPRRRVAALVLIGALVAGAWWPVESAWRASRVLAVVRAPRMLSPGDVQLDAGQVVEVIGRDGDDVRVRVTRDLDGVLPASTLWFPWSAR